MQYKPRKNYRHTLIVGGTLLAIALCFVVFASMGWGYLWLNQLGTIGSLTALIFIAVRYILTDFVYFFPESADVLEVRRISGRLPYTVARIEISADDIILPYTKNLKKEHGLKLFENGCASLFPEESYVYICTLNGKKAGVRLECKADLAALLEQAIEKKKQSPSYWEAPLPDNDR